MDSAFRPANALRMGILFMIIGAVFIALNFSPKYSILPNWNYWDSSFPLEPNSTVRTNIGFIRQGHFFAGKITVWAEGWGKNQSQVFARIEDSSGNIVSVSSMVDGIYTFALEAPKDDYYYFHFNNTYSSLNPSGYQRKVVFWQIFYYGNYTLVFQTLASIFWVSGVLSMGASLLYREEDVRDIPELSRGVIRKIVKNRR